MLYFSGTGNTELSKSAIKFSRSAMSFSYEAKTNGDDCNAKIFSAIKSLLSFILN